MGDRFYMQQQAHFGKAKRNGPTKPKRRLKKDIVASISLVLGKELPSLSKMTIADLEYIEEFLNNA